MFVRRATTSASCMKRSSRPNNIAGMILAALLWAASTTAAAAAHPTSAEPSLDLLGRGEGSTTALLVALQQGQAGEIAIREWSVYAGNFGFEEEGEQEESTFAMPSVWILCTETKTALLVEELPHVNPLLSTPDQSWAELLQEFVQQNEIASIFGLLGEGALPHRNLGRAIRSLEPAIVGSTPPTAILTRARSQGAATSDGVDGASSSSSSEVEGRWLPDTFVSQIWVNAAMLGSERLHEIGLHKHAVDNMPLLHIIPRLIEDPEGSGVLLVDGTSVMKSLIALEGDTKQPLLPADTLDSEAVYIGGLELALVQGVDDGRVDIATAPWPPLYVLETVANENGLVIVNSVNCGYLDLATNFLQSVRRVSDAQVLWVTTDEVAFDFMDNLAPGCAAMFPSEGSVRHHAIAAGSFRGATFKSQTIIRPEILLSVLMAGYNVLWTDSDVVWLGNPLVLLPDINDPESAEVVLSFDRRPGILCTCFIYLQPTDMNKELMVMWKQSIIDLDANEDQGAFKPAFHHQEDAGLRVEMIPLDVFVSGINFFNHPYVENYTDTYHPEALVAHNNWISGHGRKVSRFKGYHLWTVEDVLFPKCSG